MWLVVRVVTCYKFLLGLVGLKWTVKDDRTVERAPTPHILFEELRQREMLEGLCQLHAALIISRLGSLTEPNQRTHTHTHTHTRTHTDVLMLMRSHKGQRLFSSHTTKQAQTTQFSQWDVVRNNAFNIYLGFCLLSSTRGS